MNPLVSVIMPIFNSEKYLREAIESILNQTYKHFEFLIIDDASTDASVEIIKAYKDDRIKLIRKPNNTGYTVSLNMGLKISRGTYIARMDSDDVSLPLRLEKQVMLMEKNPQIGVCGTWVKTICKQKSVIKKYCVNHEQIRAELFISSHFIHPTVMFRKDILDKYNLTYDTAFEPAEDYALWIEISKYANLTNIPEVLLKYRLHENQVSAAFSSKQLMQCNIIRQMQVNQLGIVPTQEEWQVHIDLILDKYEKINIHQLNSILKWLLKLKDANESTKVFDNQVFYMVLLRHAYVAYSKMPYNLNLLRLATMPPFSILYISDQKRLAKFVVRCLLGLQRKRDAKAKKIF